MGLEARHAVRRTLARSLLIRGMVRLVSPLSARYGAQHLRFTRLVPPKRLESLCVCVSMPRSVFRHGDPVTLPLRDRGFERDATHCPSRGEHVIVTRTLSRVVDRVEAYIFNRGRGITTRAQKRKQVLPTSKGFGRKSAHIWCARCSYAPLELSQAVPAAPEVGSDTRVM
jgi:hypothetical protein